ncbi:hypothetical protein OUZ56_001180 [Daphnia magna]|uniref:Uncharacterized protein n=1 Tax=Daphnia magna TaxID=35525 RepID=A0ABR0A206_9CRUS|nr:hypothetical protein OUZ56_001180 [Daphnia magna]
MEAIAVVLIAMNESTKREDYLAFYLFKFAVMLKQINEQKLFGLLHRLVVTFKNIWQLKANHLIERGLILLTHQKMSSCSMLQHIVDDEQVSRYFPFAIIIV